MVLRQKIVSVSCGMAPRRLVVALAEVTEWYGTCFFKHRQFACVKILAERCIALCYGVEHNGRNQALIGVTTGPENF